MFAAPLFAVILEHTLYMYVHRRTSVTFITSIYYNNNINTNYNCYYYFCLMIK